MPPEPYRDEEPYYDEGEGEPAPEPFRPLRGVAVTIYVLLGVGLLLSVVQLFMDSWLIAIAEESLAGRQVPQHDIDLFDTLALALMVIHLVVRLATAVAFITWLYRAYKNVPTLGAGDTKFSPGWAIGAWFVPILNLFRPYQIVREAWDAGEPYAEGDDADRILRPASPALLGVWWGMWILSGILGQIAMRMSFAARTPQEILVATRLGLASEVFTLVNAVLAILVVRRVTDRQEARERALAEAEERWAREEGAGHRLPPAGPDSEHIRERRRPRDLDPHFRPLEDDDRGRG